MSDERTFTEADLEIETESVILTEAIDAKGLEWNVTIIRPGLSLKRVEWDPAVLEKAAQMYEGIKVGVNMTYDHPEDSGVPRTVVGWIDGIKTEAGKIVGRLHVSEKYESLRGLLVKAFKEGRPFGLSHVVRARHYEALGNDGRPVTKVDAILKPEFVDIVMRPSAGGALDLLVAGLATETKQEEPLVGDDATDATKKSESPTIVTKEATKTETTDTTVTEALDTLRKQTEELTAQVAVEKSGRLLEAKLGSMDIADSAKKHLRGEFDGKVFTEAEFDKKAASIRGLLDTFSATKAGGAARVEITGGASEIDRITDEMTESLFNVKTVRDAKGTISDLKLVAQRLRRDSSPRGWYEVLTGDTSMTGQMQKSGRLTESIASTTFSAIMGDSITRALLANYRALNLDSWRQWVKINRVTDFRTQRRQRLGGYGNLATVNQGAAYAAMTSPTDQETTYIPSKRGGTEDLTLEAIANDDLGAMREIPRRMARAAAQTLHEFIYDFLRTNPNVPYEAVALFNAAHNNYLSTASNSVLNLSNLVGGRNLMLKQTDMSSSKRLGIRPRFLVVPIDLEQTAYELTQSTQKPATAENDPNFARGFGLNVIVVEYLTNALNWMLVSDPADAPTIEVGFFNGQEEPELFVQDQPTVGNVFTNDKITYKIRHIYGAGILDHRAFVGAGVTFP
jgi:hypothetical protein